MHKLDCMSYQTIFFNYFLFILNAVCHLNTEIYEVVINISKVENIFLDMI